MEISGNVVNRWIAYFDILGFSEMVNKTDSQNDYLGVIGLYEEALQNQEKLKNLYGDKFDLLFTWFSDSFLICSKDDSANSFLQLRGVATNFIDLCLLSKIPMRGSITSGFLFVDKENSVFIGKGLVEAVFAADCQNWIGLIMTKAAVNKANEMELPPEKLSFVKDEIPLNFKGKAAKTDLSGCLAYTFFTKSGGDTFFNPLLKNLLEMKEFAPLIAREKYDNSIKHIKKYQGPYGNYPKKD